MNKEFYVYRFIQDGLIVYVGRTTDLAKRFTRHERYSAGMDVEYITCSSEAEMIWKEIYYINLFYNEKSLNVADVYTEGKFKIYDLNDSWKKFDMGVFCSAEFYEVTKDDYNNFISNLPKYNYAELINVLDHEKLNSIGRDKYAIAEHWFIKDEDAVKKLKNNIQNFFRNIMSDARSESSLWTTYFNCKKLLTGRGYTKGYVSLYNRDIGLYPQKTNLTYAANLFYPAEHSCELTQDEYALYNLLTFMFKSGLYYGKQITIYIPSKRMRTLLRSWIDNQFYL